MASTTGPARSGHSRSSRLVTVTKLPARKTPTTPGTAKSRAASGETSGATTSGKFAVAPRGITSSLSTHLMLCGLGVRSACMRKERGSRGIAGS